MEEENRREYGLSRTRRQCVSDSVESDGIGIVIQSRHATVYCLNGEVTEPGPACRQTLALLQELVLRKR